MQVARIFGEEGKVLVEGFWRINVALNGPKDNTRSQNQNGNHTRGPVITLQGGKGLERTEGRRKQHNGKESEVLVQPLGRNVLAWNQVSDGFDHVPEKNAISDGNKKAHGYHQCHAQHIGFRTKGRAGNGFKRMFSRPILVGWIQVIGTGHQETKAKVGNEYHRDQNEGSEKVSSELVPQSITIPLSMYCIYVEGTQDVEQVYTPYRRSLTPTRERSRTSTRKL
jgi:hypothetical protein